MLQPYPFDGTLIDRCEIWFCSGRGTFYTRLCSYVSEQWLDDEVVERVYHQVIPYSNIFCLAWLHLTTGESLTCVVVSITRLKLPTQAAAPTIAIMKKDKGLWGLPPRSCMIFDGSSETPLFFCSLVII